MWTFVDDWQFTGPDVSSVEQGFQTIGHFTDMLDLDLDDRKSFFWGTSGEIRAELRSQSKVVKLHVRNLGGHVSYCRMPTNFTITERIRATSIYKKSKTNKKRKARCFLIIFLICLNFRDGQNSKKKQKKTDPSHQFSFRGWPGI